MTNQTMTNKPMTHNEERMPKVDPVYYYALATRNKLVYCLDWLLMRIHTWRTGIKHKGANPRVLKEE